MALSSLAGDVLVAVQDDLGTEWWVAGHLDGDVAPLRIQDVERVVIDVRLLLVQVLDQPASRALDVPDGRHGAADQDQEQAALDRVCGEVFLGDAMLALTTSAVDDRDPVRSRKTMHAPTEATSHPHQVRVVEVGFGAVVQTPPPFAKAAGRVTQRIERIEHDAIDAVIAALQQVAIPLAELVGHPTRVDGSAPSGATGSGPRPRTSVGRLGSGRLNGVVKFSCGGLESGTVDGGNDVVIDYPEGLAEFW
jgi:hypothetical protein